jgi:ribonuclease HI
MGKIEEMNNILLIKTDGGARGNPGPAAIGVYIFDPQQRKIISRFGKFIGHSTNNVAEYQAVLLAWEWLVKNKNSLLPHYQQFQFITDSQLMANQLNGLYKIKNPTLQTLAGCINQLKQSMNVLVRYHNVRREMNREPDKILNDVLDKNVL